VIWSNAPSLWVWVWNKTKSDFCTGMLSDIRTTSLHTSCTQKGTDNHKHNRQLEIHGHKQLIIHSQHRLVCCYWGNAMLYDIHKSIRSSAFLQAEWIPMTTSVSFALSQLLCGSPQGLLQWLGSQSDDPIVILSEIHLGHMLKEPKSPLEQV